MPPDVTQALRRLQGGVGTDADKQILAAFLTANQAALPPEDLVVIQVALRQPTTPAQPGGTSGAMPNMGGGPGTDWAVEAQNQGLATGGLPPSSGPSMPGLADLWNIGNPGGGTQSGGPFTTGPTISGGISLPTPGDIFATGNPGGGLGIGGGSPGGGNLAGQSPQYFSPSNQGLTPRGAPPDTPPALPGAPLANPGSGTTAPEDWRRWDPNSIGGPPAPPGVTVPGAGNPLAERMAQRQEDRYARRGDYGGEGGPGGGTENWKQLMNQFTNDPTSPFYHMNPAASEIYANPDNVAMLSNLLYGQPGQPEGLGSMMTPYVQGAMGLAGMGALSGHRKQGLGTGPTDAGDTIALAQGFLDQLGPGDFVNPSATYREAWKRVQHTDPSYFAPKGTTDADWGSQISNTKQALLISAAPFMTQDNGDALAQRIDIAAETWLHLISTGQTTQTFPQYLKDQGAAHWVSG